MSCHNKSAGMTHLGETVHERCKTGECSITTATVCTTTVDAAVALLVLSGRQRLMGHILSRPQDDAIVQGETGEGGQGKGKVVKEGKQEGHGEKERERQRERNNGDIVTEL